MIGRTISHYEITAELGRGGMGVVYKARDTSLNRTVALKFLPSELTRDSSARERFVREAQAAAATDHPNICTIHEIGESDDGQTYIVMAYYGDETLKERIAGGGLSAEEAAGVLAQVAKGLQTAHANGIVHRDIKPGNIVLTEDGIVKILDFGLAKLAGTTDLTRTSSTLGTMYYMAPEQVRAEEATAAADIWALGATAYEMLTGRTPFTGDYEQAVLYAVLNEPHEPVEQARPDLPSGLASFVDQCLSKIAADRPVLTNELVEELRLVARGGETASAERPAAAQAATPWYHEPLPLASVYGLGAVVVVALVYLVVMQAGLPDWVLVVAAVLLALGLPAVLMAGYFDRNRHAAATQAGLGGFWTLRKAVIGGGLVFGGLTAATVAFALMRTLGVGPGATLISSGVLGEEDQLILAEFENRTPDSTLARSVTELIRIDLNQSRAIKLVQPPDIRAGLERMQRSTDTFLGEDVARQLASREGIKAVIIGSVADVAGSYMISAEVVATSDGQTKIAVREVADSPREVVRAADRLSASLRDRIGESLKQIRASDPLERVTTSSLEALTLFTQAERAFDQLDFNRSIALLEEAITLDSTFAMAHRKLAINFSRQASDIHRLHEAIRTAYRLRERLPELERYQAEGIYHWATNFNPSRAANAYRSLLQIDSTNIAALVNITGLLNQVGRHSEAIPFGRRAVLHHPDEMATVENLMDGYLAVGDSIAAEKLLDQALSRHGEGFLISRWRALEAGSRRDYESVAGYLDDYRRRAEGNLLWMWDEAWFRYSLHSAQGQLGPALESLDRFASLSLERELPHRYVQAQVERVLVEVTYLGASQPALAYIEDVLEEFPLESMSPGNRPYDWLAVLYAYSGRQERAEELLAEYDRILPLNDLTNRPLIHAARGTVALTAGQYEQALAQLRKCERMVGGWPISLCGPYEISLALEGLGRRDEAIQELRRVDEWTRGTRIMDERRVLGPSYMKLGELYELEGDLREAQRYYGKLLALWEDADPVLEPTRTLARERIDAIAAQLAGEPT